MPADTDFMDKHEPERLGEPEGGGRPPGAFVPPRPSPPSAPMPTPPGPGAQPNPQPQPGPAAAPVPKPQAGAGSLNEPDGAMQTFDELPAKSQELARLQDEAEKTCGPKAEDLNRKIRKIGS